MIREGMVDNTIAIIGFAIVLFTSERAYSAISFNFFNGRILTAILAGFALNIVSSPVKGLIPLRAFLAGFLTVTIFIKPGSTNSPQPRFLT